VIGVADGALEVRQRLGLRVRTVLDTAAARTCPMISEDVRLR